MKLSVFDSDPTMILATTNYNATLCQLEPLAQVARFDLSTTVIRPPAVRVGLQTLADGPQCHDHGGQARNNPNHGLNVPVSPGLPDAYQASRAKRRRCSALAWPVSLTIDDRLASSASVEVDVKGDGDGLLAVPGGAWRRR